MVDVVRDVRDVAAQPLDDEPLNPQLGKVVPVLGGVRSPLRLSMADRLALCGGDGPHPVRVAKAAVVNVHFFFDLNN